MLRGSGAPLLNVLAGVLTSSHSVHEALFSDRGGAVSEPAPAATRGLVDRGWLEAVLSARVDGAGDEYENGYHGEYCKEHGT